MPHEEDTAFKMSDGVLTLNVKHSEFIKNT